MFACRFVLTDLTRGISSERVDCQERRYIEAIRRDGFSFIVEDFEQGRRCVRANFINERFLNSFLQDFGCPRVRSFYLCRRVIVVLRFFFGDDSVFTKRSQRGAICRDDVSAADFLGPLLRIFARIPRVGVLVSNFFRFVTIRRGRFTERGCRAFTLIAVRHFVAIVRRLNRFTQVE